jgi:integrase
VRYVTQLKGRSGYYVRYPVPNQYRKQLGRACYERKCGNTMAECRANMHRVIAEIQQEIAVRVGAADEVLTWRRTFGEPEQLSQSEKVILLQSVDLEDKQTRTKVEAYLENHRSYNEIFDERVLVEQPVLSTQRNWRTHIKQLVEWSGSEYPHTIDKEIAKNYRNYLLSRISHNSARASISCLKGFWAFGINNGYLSENVWQGLTRKLDQAVKHELPSGEVLAAALEKAIHGDDLRFLLMYYTGGRSSDVNGLRGTDLDLENRTIRFEEWSLGDTRRRLKGGRKDERVIPMHSQIEAFLRASRIRYEDGPIWPKAYKPGDQTWGAGWSGSFRDKYGFVSHDLRRNVVTQLAVAGVSPFLINAITRQKIPGLSEVVELYVRPSVEELRAAIELIK